MDKGMILELKVHGSWGWGKGHESAVCTAGVKGIFSTIPIALAMHWLAATFLVTPQLQVKYMSYECSTNHKLLHPVLIVLDYKLLGG
jgi:hypothetical protein